MKSNKDMSARGVKKTIKDIIERDWADKGSQILKSFDIVLDCS